MIEPYYQTAHATLYHGDCLAVLPGLLAGSVDLILADLPYGTTACAWDAVIPLDKLWTEYKRVLKPRGTVILTASQPFTSVLVMSNLDWFRYCWVWRKSRPNGFLAANDRPMKAHEDVAVFYAQEGAYQPQGLVLVNKSNRNSGRENVYGKVKPGYQQAITYTNYPSSVLDFPSITNPLHPTQKPVTLGRYFIRTYSNPGDVVLDNTMGVGSFIVAAIEEGRRAIGIERAPDQTTADDYCGIARDRVLAAEAARGYAVPLDAARRPLQLGLGLPMEIPA